MVKRQPTKMQKLWTVHEINLYILTESFKNTKTNIRTKRTLNFNVHLETNNQKYARTIMLYNSKLVTQSTTLSSDKHRTRFCTYNKFSRSRLGNLLCHMPTIGMIKLSANFLILASSHQP